MAIIKTKFDRGVEGATNIVDSGTEGTKVASGTTAQRGSTTGQWRYNTTTNFFEGRNANGNFQSLEPVPTVASVDVSEVDSTASGNQTIVVTGTNFSTGGTIAFVGTSAEFNASTTTFNNDSQVTAVAPKSSFLNAQEPYKVKFTSATGLAGTSATGLINVDANPTWSTTSGQIGGNNIVEGISASTTVSATDADNDTIVYSVQSGSLPSGLSLNSNSGVISGTPSSVSGDTTSSFTLRATANNKTTDRAFNIITKENTITNHASSNWTHYITGNRADSSGRYFTTSSTGASGYLYGVSSENASSGSASHEMSWLQSNNGIASSYWRGQGSAPQQDTLELWFGGNEVVITNIVIHSYDSSAYEFDSVKLQYWNNGWYKVAGIGSFSGVSSGWSWSKSGSNSRTNTITHNGTNESSYKSTNWRFVYGTGGNDVHNGSDVVHQTGASNLNFKILG